MKKADAARVFGLALGAAALSMAAAPAAFAQDDTQAQSQTQTDAEHLPLWELRLGGSALYAPDYPGSDDYHVHAVGAPLFIYRGERLRIGNDEPNAIARAIAVENRRFELSVSVDANYGADSSNNDARQGMPDLDTQLEIGPQLTVNLIDTGWTDDGRRRLRILLPVRDVGATDFKHWDNLGWIFQPTLTYRRQWADGKASFSTSLAVVYASEGVQDYYYQVDPLYATASRPAYDAQGGYLGTHLQISGRREIRPGLNVYLTYRLRSLAGAENEDSPLHREDLTQAFSISAVWTAFHSQQSARNHD